MIALALLVPLALCTLSAGQDFDLEPKRPVWPDEYQVRALEHIASRRRVQG